MTQNTRDISVRVELYEHAVLTRHSLKQGDTTRLIMDVRRGGEPYDLNGLGLLLNVKREDELVYIQTGGYELDYNTVTWTLESPIAAESGHIELEAVLTAESGEVISSFIFRLNIEPRLLSGDEDIAPDDQNEIIDAARDAALSVAQARDAASAASQSAANARESAQAAAVSAQAAADSANSADASAKAASDSEAKVKASQESASRSAASAQESAESAQKAQTAAEAAKNDAANNSSAAEKSAVKAETAASAAKSDAAAAKSAAGGASTSAADARVSANSAGNSAGAAAQSAANAAKSEAAAEQAKAEAEQLRDAAVSDINTAKAGAVTAVENAGGAAVSGVITARDTAVGAVENARNAAVEAVGGAGNAETAKVGQAGADAVGGVNAARDSAVADVDAAADKRIEEIEQAGGGTGTDVGAVRFDAAQELTEEQQATARNNIGAGGAIVETAQGDGVVTVDDSAAAALRGLRIFGKSTQEIIKGINMLDLTSLDGRSSCIINADGTVTSNINNNYFSSITYSKGFSVENLCGATLLFRVASIPSDTRLSILVYGAFTGGAAYREASGEYGGNYVTLSIPTTMTSFSLIDLRFNRKDERHTDTSTVFRDFMLAITSDVNTPYEPYSNGAVSPSPDYPAPINSVGDKGTIGVSVAETGQTLTHATPGGLPGVPVKSGGNYTDASGQQWVCDEVDFGRGVYVQRIGQIDSYAGETLDTEYISTTGSLTTGAKVLYALAEPTETPLTEEQLTAYRALRTQYPTTNVTNDEGAGMEVSYIADTKAYIDKKFAELSAAIINS